jgi:hypothetical protein
LTDVAAGFAVWVGASLVVLSDGRRGLALGVAVAAVGVALAAWPRAGPEAALALGAGGLVAAAWRSRAGPPGWRILAAGSTPRLVLCVAAALLTLWLAVAVTSGPYGGMRFAVMVAAGLAVARILDGEEPAVLQTAAAVLALAVGTVSGLGGGQPGIWTFAAGSLVAAAAGLLPVSAARAA